MVDFILIVEVGVSVTTVSHVKINDLKSFLDDVARDTPFLTMRPSYLGNISCFGVNHVVLFFIVELGAIVTDFQWRFAEEYLIKEMYSSQSPN